MLWGISETCLLLCHLMPFQYYLTGVLAQLFGCYWGGPHISDIFRNYQPRIEIPKCIRQRILEVFFHRMPY